MPPRKPAPGSPEDWLARAKSDLLLASMPLPEGAFYEDLCFHAQQAAEKAMKAVFQFHGWPFPYTHDLDALAQLLEEQGIAVPSEVAAATDLTDFAWESRYPGLYEAVSADDSAEAVRLAGDVVTWAERIIRGESNE